MPSRHAVVTRFAPSPTGELHLGHAYSALLAWSAARQTGGRFLLRMEDIDRGRCRPEHESAILADLEWLGIDWDGEVRRQSRHFDAYRAVLDRLSAAELLYPCFCTRREIQAEIAAMGRAPHGPEGPVYPGTCRGLSTAERQERIAAGQPYALRLDMARAIARVRGRDLIWIDEEAGSQRARPEIHGDVVLARKDTPASYHIAACHDDALQEITLIVRGKDLFDATHLHCLLQALLDWPTPRYRHHRLILDENGKRLAKRTPGVKLRELRERGVTPADIRAMLALPRDL